MKTGRVSSTVHYICTVVIAAHTSASGAEQCANAPSDQCLQAVSQPAIEASSGRRTQIVSPSLLPRHRQRERDRAVRPFTQQDPHGEREQEFEQHRTLLAAVFDPIDSSHEAFTRRQVLDVDASLSVRPLGDAAGGPEDLFRFPRIHPSS